MTDWKALTEFKELWFPCPRVRLPELGSAGPIFIEGGRCVSGGSLGWRLSLTHIIGHGSFHGLIRLDDGRLIPISRTHGEDVFKSSWVMFSR